MDGRGTSHELENLPWWHCNDDSTYQLHNEPFSIQPCQLQVTKHCVAKTASSTGPGSALASTHVHSHHVKSSSLKSLNKIPETLTLEQNSQ